MCVYIYISCNYTVLSKRATQGCGKIKFFTRIHEVKHNLEILCASIGTRLLLVAISCHFSSSLLHK